MQLLLKNASFITDCIFEASLEIWHPCSSSLDGIVADHRACMVFFMWFEGLETERSRRIPLLLHMTLLAPVYNFLFPFFFIQQVPLAHVPIWHAFVKLCSCVIWFINYILPACSLMLALACLTQSACTSFIFHLFSQAHFLDGRLHTWCEIRGWAYLNSYAKEWLSTRLYYNK